MDALPSYLTMLGEGGNEPFDVGGEEGGERVVTSVELLRVAVPQVEGDVRDLVVLLLSVQQSQSIIDS